MFTLKKSGKPIILNAARDVNVFRNAVETDPATVYLQAGMPVKTNANGKLEFFDGEDGTSVFAYVLIGNWVEKTAGNYKADMLHDECTLTNEGSALRVRCVAGEALKNGDKIRPSAFDATTGVMTVKKSETGFGVTCGTVYSKDNNTFTYALGEEVHVFFTDVQ